MAQKTIQDVLNNGNPAQIGDAMRQVGLGDMITPIKNTVSQSAAATIALDPPALHITSVRVTAGNAAAGPRTVTDAAGTATTTVCKLSDDGTTLTFEDTLTGAIVVYTPRAATDTSADFVPATR